MAQGQGVRKNEFRGGKKRVKRGEWRKGKPKKRDFRGELCFCYTNSKVEIYLEVFFLSCRMHLETTVCCHFGLEGSLPAPRKNGCNYKRAHASYKLESVEYFVIGFHSLTFSSLYCVMRKDYT